MKKLDEKDYAFAIQETDVHYGQWGLTKREWFAGLALQGLIANEGFGGTESSLAYAAIKCADKLLEELNK